MDTVALVDPGRPQDARASAPPEPLRLEVTRDGTTLFVPVHSSRALTPDAAVQRVVIVIQGDRRRPIDYLESVAHSAAAAGAEDVLALAPYFRVAGELDPGERPSGAAYWSPSGWKEGGLSRCDPWDRPWRISSFAVVDSLITAVAGSGLWSGIADVLIVGHSAGGQFVQRFAAGSRIQESLATLGLRYRFIVANPSSYLYLSRHRFVASSGTFVRLSDDQLAACPRANRYKYGLRGLNEYMSASDRASIRQRYLERTIDYVVGELDTHPEDARFDTTCAGRLQGGTRYGRGRTFHDYLGHLFGGDVYARHRLLVVPGVGHDVRSILSAPNVQAAMFGRSPASAAAG